jgi:membrane protein insertase Oxa1/YidC/SpoIIIJ
MQAKIMLLLPAFLTVLFLTFPAGLVLYWLTNNVLTITQQFVTDRYIFKKPTFAGASGDSQSGLSQASSAEGTDGGQKPGKRRKEQPAQKTGDRDTSLQAGPDA